MRMKANTPAPARRAMRRAPTTSAEPPCANSQPRPSPAASPARGASQRLPPEGCGVGCCVGGAACFGGVVIWRCAPRLRPPPSRAASASSDTRPAPTTSTYTETLSSLLDFPSVHHLHPLRMVATTALTVRHSPCAEVASHLMLDK